jgi:hypothetical protein
MKTNSKQHSSGGRLRRLVRHVAYYYGYVVVPISELDRMESDAKSDLAAAWKKSDPRTSGYFQGMSDYASKKAIQLREAYLPNAKLSHEEGGKEQL